MLYLRKSVKSRESSKSNIFFQFFLIPSILHRLKWFSLCYSVCCITSSQNSPELHKSRSGKAEDRLHLDHIRVLLALNTCNCLYLVDRAFESHLQSSSLYLYPWSDTNFVNYHLFISAAFL